MERLEKLSHHRQMTQEPDSEPISHTALAIKLRLPELTSEAILAGIFGRCPDGGYRPSPRELREFMEAQVNGLVDWRRRIDGFERAERLGYHPLSGKLAKSRFRRAANSRRAGQLAKEYGLRYLGYLGAYERAFGAAARVELDEFVRAVTDATTKSDEPMLRQRELF